MSTTINNPQTKYARWIVPKITGAATATWTAGTVYLMYFEVDKACKVDGIAIRNGGTIAGNVTVGIYRPVSTTPDTPEGGSVVVQSASTAHAGANVSQTVTFTETELAAGSYYAAIELSDATATIAKQLNNAYDAGGINHYSYYARGGGYGALTDPCPAVTTTSTGTTALTFAVRVSSIT